MFQTWLRKKKKKDQKGSKVKKKKNPVTDLNNPT